MRRVLAHQGCVSASRRFYGNAPERVRPWEEVRQPLLLQGARDMSTMLMVCCIVAVPVFMVVVVTPTTWKRREEEAQWALNLLKDREEGKPAYYSKEAVDVRWDNNTDSNIMNSEGTRGYFSDRRRL